MDTALYEKASRLLEAQLRYHRRERRLQSLRTKAEADVPAIIRRLHQLHPKERQQHQQRERESRRHHSMQSGQLSVYRSYVQPPSLTNYLISIDFALIDQVVIFSEDFYVGIELRSCRATDTM